MCVDCNISIVIRLKVECVREEMALYVNAHHQPIVLININDLEVVTSPLIL